MKNLYIILIAALTLYSCKEEPKTQIAWVHTKTINLQGINPIGIAQDENGLWLSDGDHNRVVQVNLNGDIQQSIDSLDRPMHIATDAGIVYIPQYGNDEVLSVLGATKKAIAITDSLDAPAGIDARGNAIAIADFYNNRILYTEDGVTWSSFGKEGKADGDFYYPTDVQITDDAIWVADAYNNRLQKFDKKGNHLMTVGEDQKMNAATGIYVSDKEVFSTDFENNRVLVFDHEGNFKQEINDAILKPTDMLLVGDILYVTNYKGKSLSVYEQKEVLVEAPLEEEHRDDHNH
ncbi:NHL repeat-containing protein [Dokdonia sp. 4H-3-7-5]|uniref:NHL repeat-containing protein n=1 Tax=Dokdonia sp. (strain 4H-3-7-5) TaxID=983548 RepID=UPI00020A6DAA|nr:NHL repeat-containing protein [Dokdonia sp. 4H-3-7-5]AEE19648.1 NHL repeat containing protein [Dokdonia sp. 4H-3-7-5]